MSMIGNYLRVSESELQEYLADSNKLEDRVSDNDPEDTSLIDIDKAWNGIFYSQAKHWNSSGRRSHRLNGFHFPKMK